ncbi:hypothetical protein CS8_010250 [Cupriavidus sp. 8B]
MRPSAALREIDQERTLRQKGEQAVAELRTELAAAADMLGSRARAHFMRAYPTELMAAEPAPLSPRLPR